MPKKILLVEDEDILANMYRLKISKAGYQVEVADDGEQGLVMAKKNRPDLILLDVIMPKKDGFTMLKELKSDVSLKKIPVFLLTNLGQEEDIKKGKELGAIDYFIKANFTPGELLIKINNYFNQ